MAEKFNLGAVLTVVTGAALCAGKEWACVLRHVIGDDFHMHQVGRILSEVRPWILAQYPQFNGLKAELGNRLDATEDRAQECQQFLAEVQARLNLPDLIPIEPFGETGRGLHLEIDPVEELRAMVGDDRVIEIELLGD